MQKEKTCFFIGRRDASKAIYSQLYDAVMEHIDIYGVTEFLVGHYGSFDRMAASAVTEAKNHYSHIILTMLLPYISPKRDVTLVDGYAFNGSVYPEGLEKVPPRFAIPRANRWAVDHAGFLIAYVGNSVGNSRSLTEYAISKGVSVTELKCIP